MVKKSNVIEIRDDDAVEGTKEPLGETDFCPIGRALDIIGARWTLVLVRHLLAGPRRFQELRDLTGVAPRLLSIRLAQLIERGLVEKVPVGNRSIYALTEFGQTLDPIVHEVAIWWVRYAMRQSGPFRQATPASALEALTFLLRRDRRRDPEVSYDVRLTIKEGGGWTVEFSDPSSSSSTGLPESRKQPTAAELADLISSSSWSEGRSAPVESVAADTHAAKNGSSAKPGAASIPALDDWMNFLPCPPPRDAKS